MSFQDIAALEQALDDALVDRRTIDRFAPTWLDAGKRWSSAVWDAIGSAPRREPSMATPVLLCGTHRSGTTFLRDLLDGHPQLSVLPAEAAYLGPLQARLAALDSASAAREFGEMWLRRLANPINQPPFWLCGRSTITQSPYVAFAQRLAGALGPSPDYRSLHPLAAVASAWQTDGTAIRWVEKTPGTERHLRWLWRNHPEARVIHVIRDPAAAALSYRALLNRANPGAAPASRMIRDLITSYRIAAQLARSGPEDRYRILRYEELAADTTRTMSAIAEFIGIEMHGSLLQATIAGHPAEPNTSHRPDDAPLPRMLMHERALLTIAQRAYRKIPRVTSA